MGEVPANNPKPEEVETELRAQIRRALESGLRIDYLDYHMGAAVTTLELRMVVEKLAKEFVPTNSVRTRHVRESTLQRHHFVTRT